MGLIGSDSRVLVAARCV